MLDLDLPTYPLPTKERERAIRIADELEDVIRELKESLADGQVSFGEVVEFGIEVGQLAAALFAPALGHAGERTGLAKREERKRRRANRRAARRADRLAGEGS